MGENLIAGCNDFIMGFCRGMNLMCLLYNILFDLSTPFLNIFLKFEEFFSPSFIFLHFWCHFCKILTSSFIFCCFFMHLCNEYAHKNMPKRRLFPLCKMNIKTALYGHFG